MITSNSGVGTPWATNNRFALILLKAKELGLAQTFYLNATGLDVSDHLAGAYGSARDQAHLLATFYNNFADLLRCTTLPKATLKGPASVNTNLDVGKTIGIIGSKTGFTDLAGGNLAVVVDAGINHPVVIVVLGSTQSGRFTDVENLSQATLQYLADQI